MPPKKYTSETLAPIVACATSLADTLRLLGLPPSGGNYRFIKARMRMFGLDTSHFGRSTLKRRLGTLADAELRELAKRSGSIAEILQSLDLPCGIANDNRLDNVRLLCPNCHSQTETYCNKARPSRASEPRAHYSCYTKRHASVLE